MPLPLAAPLASLVFALTLSILPSTEPDEDPLSPAPHIRHEERRRENVSGVWGTEWEATLEKLRREEGGTAGESRRGSEQGSSATSSRRRSEVGEVGRGLSVIQLPQTTERDTPSSSVSVRRSGTTPTLSTSPQSWHTPHPKAWNEDGDAVYHMSDEGFGSEVAKR